MPTYLITISDHYYPSPGPGDWHGLYLDEDEARAEFRGLRLRYQDAYLIEVDGTEYRVLGSPSRDSRDVPSSRPPGAYPPPMLISNLAIPESEHLVRIEPSLSGSAAVYFEFDRSCCHMSLADARLIRERLDYTIAEVEAQRVTVEVPADKLPAVLALGGKVVA